MPLREKILVTSALPYANGPLHVGHLAGAYLPADIFVRYHRRKGSDVVYICGSDEHGVPITLTADAEGIEPQDVVDRFHARLKGAFEGLDFSLDYYGRTTSPTHVETAQRFFRVLDEGGFIEPRTEEQFYCPSCARYMPDRYVEGICPHCGSDKARGDQCEDCGRWIEPQTLIEPRCKICGGAPELRPTKHWYFKLSELAGELETWIDERHREFGWKDNVLNYCRGWFREGLKDRPITRDLSWGVPAPVEDEGKVLYVWFEAVLGYITDTRDWAASLGEPERWRDYWLDDDTRLVHFIGKDNIIFHAIMFPAMILAHNRSVPAEERIVLPENVPANEFLNIEGRKLSTSRNWAVWVDDVLAEFPADYLRYYLASSLPETRDADFSWSEFGERVNSELADIYGNLANRVLVFVNRYFDGRVPERGETDTEARHHRDEVSRLLRGVGESIEDYRFREAARRMMDIARTGNRYFDAEEPWRTRKEDPEACARTIHHLVQTLAVLAAASEPFTPKLARELAGLLGLDDDAFAGLNWERAAEPELITAGTRLAEPKVLVAKLEPEVLETQRARLHGDGPPERHNDEPKDEVDQDAGGGIKDDEAGSTPGVAPLSTDQISFDDFTRLDLRVARIVEAEAVPKAKKLLRLVVDLGLEQRQIVAGIAKHYTPEELLGRRVVVVANLKPAKLMGVLSEGMLLAASTADKSGLALVCVPEELPPGARVS